MNLPLQGDSGDLPNAKIVVQVGDSSPVETHVIPEERNPSWERVVYAPCDSVAPGSELDDSGEAITIMVTHVMDSDSVHILPALIPLKVQYSQPSPLQAPHSISLRCCRCCTPAVGSICN